MSDITFKEELQADYCFNSEDYYEHLIEVPFIINLSDIQKDIEPMKTKYEKQVYLSAKFGLAETKDALNHYYKVLREAQRENVFPEMPAFWLGMIDASTKTKTHTDSVRGDEGLKKAYHIGREQWPLYSLIKESIVKLKNGLDVDFAISSKEYSFRDSLSKLGFFDLPTTVALNEDQETTLLTRLASNKKKDLPFKIALLEELKFVDVILSSFGLYPGSKRLAEVFNVSEINVRKTISALSDLSAPSRYNSRSRLNDARKFHNELKCRAQVI